jgi:hypothetical protein
MAWVYYLNMGSKFDVFIWLIEQVLHFIWFSIMIMYWCTSTGLQFIDIHKSY